MSVPKSKRATANAKYFYLALKIHDCIDSLVLEDFGFQRKTKEFYAFCRKAEMDDDDKKNFQELCKKYDINVEVDFPYWMIERYRNRIMDSLDQFLDDMTTANSIYPNSVYEFNLRKGYQWKTISDLEITLQYLQCIIRIIPEASIKKQKYVSFANMIDDELKLLRDWKKRCNKQFVHAYESDLKRNNLAITKISNYADSATDEIPTNNILNAASIARNQAPTIYNNSNPYTKEQIYSNVTSSSQTTGVNKAVCPIEFVRCVSPLEFNNSKIA